MKNRIRKIIIIAGCIIVSLILTFTTVYALDYSTDYNPNNRMSRIIKNQNTINEYIDSINLKNLELSTQTQENVASTITFSKLMAIDEIESYIDSYNIEIIQLQARGYDKNGNRITFFSRVDKGLDETFRILKELAESDDVKFAGVISMYALTNSSNIKNIQNDAYTLLLDTSYSTVKDLSNLKKNTETSSKNGYIFSHSIAWDAEDAGIVCYEANESLLIK